MDAESTGRPQDQGRKHRRKGAPSVETSRLLARYQAAMRDELSAILDDLAPRAPDPGLGLVAEAPKRPDLAHRSKLWDLAIKVGRELGSEIDPPDPPAGDADDPAVPARPRRRGRVDYGGA